MKKAINIIWAALLMVSFNNKQKPNVVLFYADDLGWGDLSVINSDPAYFRYTPNIDNIFRNGIIMTNYMTHCVCSPSRAGLLTGKHYAKVNSGPLTGGTLPNDIPNIAKDFKAAGYKTGAFGKWHNGMPNFPADGNGQRENFDSVKVWSNVHNAWTCPLNDNIFYNVKGWEWGHGVNAYGFDSWVGYYNGGGDLFDRYVNWHHDVDWWHNRSYAGDEKGYTTDLITRYAIKFIDENKDNPFFCYIPEHAVHNPIQIKLSDLKELCSHFPGEWDYVRKITSPASGRKIEDVNELRCEPGAEFDFEKIDPKGKHFLNLVYAAYLYSLDKSVGAVVQKIKDLGLLKNTIFLFSSDNGATPLGCNLPFKGTKHTLWEGGVHVPAAIWWPGTFDANTAPYAPDNNKYTGYIGYLDMYPTLMAMAGQKCNGTDLDGMNCRNYLKKRENPRPGLENAYYWMWSDYGSVRTDRWKLMYSQSTQRAELYDLQHDISESTDVADNNPKICDELVGMYKKWVNDNNFAVSYMAVPLKNIKYQKPEPEGDILEISATQPGINNNPYRNGIFIRCAKGGEWGESEGQYIEPGDRLEYDIYVCKDSKITEGISVCPARGSTPYFNPTNGLNQKGESVQTMKLKKGEWTRQVAGVGNLCPATLKTDYIALQSRIPGNYHFYIDNIVIRRKDGGIRAVIWQSKEDVANATILYAKKRYNSVSSALNAHNFPLEQLTISTRKSLN